MSLVLWIVIAAIVGIAIGAVVTRIVQKNSVNSARAQADSILSDAQKQADTIRREATIEAKDEAYRLSKETDKQITERLKEVKQLEQHLMQKEENLEKRVDSIDAREHQLSSLQGQVEKKDRDLTAALNNVLADLQRISGLTTEQAHQEILERVRNDVNKESAAIIRESEARTRAEADKLAREILSIAIQRVAADHTSERTVSSVQIPSDDLKGRIIGREGRNIRTFEQITGVGLIIDDTPETVVISCYDPVRREIGRLTLENLIADGRIHPARIEEMFNKATKLVNQQVQEAGEQAAFDTGIHDLHPELIKTLGRLRFRTSYGQNVLQHSLEVAYFASVMASELGLDPTIAKRAGLLHDLGKAIDHEVEGSHAVIGADLARRFGESPEVVHAIEAHHADVEPSTVVAVLVQAADAISAARPGARRESIESYIKRLEKLESIANAHEGVEKTYAMQAGREIRVMVEPNVVSDADAVVLAHDIAKQIEDEMQYPGQIKVLVIRESRSEDYAK